VIMRHLPGSATWKVYVTHTKQRACYTFYETECGQELHRGWVKRKKSILARLNQQGDVRCWVWDWV